MLPFAICAQRAHNLLVQSDSLIGEKGEFINLTVSGFYFDSDTSCFQFYFSKFNDEEFKFLENKSIRKNVIAFLQNESNVDFANLTRVYFSSEKSQVHEILRFRQSLSFDVYVLADLMIVDDVGLQVYESEDDCPHCYHSADDELYFFIYKPMKVAKRKLKKRKSD